MESLKLEFGLKNADGKYLTCETQMGGRVNATGKSLKKNQIWSFVPVQSSEGVMGHFLSSTGYYLSTDSNGKVFPSSDQTAAGLFEVRAYPDGRWVLISKLGSAKPNAQQYYLGGKGEVLDAFNKVVMVADPRDAPPPPQDRLWVVQLAMHPQVCIRNVNKKKYIHLDASGESINTTEVVPWGDDALITLVFFPEGKYGIQASNGRFLSTNGSLKAQADESCKFVLEIRGSQYAFKSSSGSYVSSATGIVRCTKEVKAVTRDELYEFEDSHPQIKLSDYASRKVSVKHGEEFTANGIREAEDDTIRFQLESHPEKANTWALRTHKDKYWTLANDADGTVLCNHDAKTGFSSAQYFTIEWYGPKMAIKASNNRYIVSSPNGNLRATGSNSSVDISSKSGEVISRYVWELINRPRLVLRTNQGFVNTLASGVLECNRPNPEVYNCHVHQGLVHISADNGKYLKVTETGISAVGTEPEYYEMELLDNTNMVLRYQGKLFQTAGNGAFTATGTTIDASTILEF